jgi:hypothetical protein
LLLTALAVAPTALAQNAPPPKKAPVPAGKPLKEIVAALTKAVGIEVLLDSSLSAAQTSFKIGEVAPETLEATLDRLVKTLPQGTAWAKVYLPEPPAGKKYRGDDVAQFVLAQASLFGKAGVSEPGKIELLGRQVPAAEAQPMLSGLKLRPYYVLRAPRRTMAGASPFGPGGLFPGGKDDIMGPLLKQLGVCDPSQIPPGNYKISIPGPNGSPMEGHVIVEDDGSGNRRIGIAINKPGGG